MGKHSIEKPKKKINFKKELVALLVIIVLVFGINFALSYKKSQKEDDTKTTSIKNSKTISNEKLVIKSNSEYNKIIEYTFENNILKTIKIYEQFETKEEYDTQKENYNPVEDITIIKADEQELSIEIEKKDFGSDEGKTYEEMYEKYLVQIIGQYQIIE